MTERTWDQDAGVVIRRITNYYTVRYHGADFMCLPRARLKKEHVRIHVGDRVRLDEIDETNQTATVAEVLERQNLLTKPAIANVDQVVLVFAADQPPFNPLLLDRFLVLVAQSGIASAIALNKADLVSPEVREQMLAPYRELGLPVVGTSAATGDVTELVALLENKVTVFAGPSGVGKSSLLNSIEPGLKLKEGEVSAKIQRGRHTTTFASLYAIRGPHGDGLVADTPGYSHLDFGGMEPKELGWYYPEMVPHIPDCRFPDCLHRGEPGCAVKERAHVPETRMASYLRFLEELEATQARLSSTSLKVEGKVKQSGETKLVKIDASARTASRRLDRQRLMGLDHAEDADLDDDLADEEREESGE